MNKWRFLSFLFLALIFSGCSYQQYFMLSNATNDTIQVSYSLNKPSGESALFKVPAEIYQANQHYYADWEHKLPYKDLDFSDNNVRIQLPAKSVLLFGNLSNEKYDSATKTTGSGKKLNLKEMTFQANGFKVTINEDNFHDYFIEEEGSFRNVIR